MGLKLHIKWNERCLRTVCTATTTPNHYAFYVIVIVPVEKQYLMSKREEMKLIKISPYVHKRPIMTSRNFEQIEMQVLKHLNQKLKF